MSSINKKNPEGYDDPTAFEALSHITDEEKKVSKIIHIIKGLCDICGFEVVGRIVLVDKKTGKVWR